LRKVLFPLRNIFAQFFDLKANQPSKRKNSGRPPKFPEPSRPITLTLPDSTLRELEEIDPDRGHAIVKLARSALRSGEEERPLVEIVEMAPNTGLIVVGPSRALRKIPFLHLIEIAPARHLIALDPGDDFHTMEIAITDALDDVPKSDKRERKLMTDLLQHIRRLRKSDRVRIAKVLFVDLQGNGKP
jgi:hypothetical protein